MSKGKRTKKPLPPFRQIGDIVYIVEGVSVDEKSIVAILPCEEALGGYLYGVKCGDGISDIKFYPLEKLETDIDCAVHKLERNANAWLDNYKRTLLNKLDEQLGKIDYQNKHHEKRVNLFKECSKMWEDYKEEAK